MTNSTKAFSIGTFSISGSPDFPGIVLDEKVLLINTLGPVLKKLDIKLFGAESVLSLTEEWDHNIAVLQQAVNSLQDNSELSNALLQKMIPVADTDVRPPVNLPRQVFCAGANYFKHVVDYIVARGPGVRPGTDGMNSEQLREFAEDHRFAAPMTQLPFLNMQTNPIGNSNLLLSLVNRHLM